MRRRSICDRRDVLLSGLDVALDLRLFVVEHGETDLGEDEIYSCADTGRLFECRINRRQCTFLYTAISL